MTTLGKYSLHEELGRGGFGIVYRSTDTVLGREVALKILHPRLMVDPSFVESFRREAKNIAVFNHPNIAAVYDMNEDSGRAYIAMQYLPGGSLRDRIESQGPHSYEEVLRVSREVATALQAAHAEGLIHRDLKPENILFAKDGHAVIGDFGLARTMQATASTSSGAGGVGTPSYRAPELWRGSPPPSPATDVYSLACVVAEMLTGNRLFDGQTPDEIITKHVVDGAKLPVEWPAGVPAMVSRIFKKALEKSPEQRYSRSMDFVSALERAATLGTEGGTAHLETEKAGTILLDGETMVVGRSDRKRGIQVNIDLSDHDPRRLISRRHASIEREGDDYFLTDLNSTNGTWLNGKRIRPKVKTALRNGDVLEFGGDRVRVSFHLQK